MSRMEVGQDGNVMSVRHRNLIRITVSSPTQCAQLAKRDYFEAQPPLSAHLHKTVVSAPFSNIANDIMTSSSAPVAYV